MSKWENGVLKVTKEELIEAGKRADKSSRGSDEEYYNHILKLYKEMTPYRKRANEVMLKEG